MKRFITYGFALCMAWAMAAGAAGPASAVDGFFAVAPDVPLLPQFEELKEQESLFDKPDGRIAHLVAVGPGAVAQISETYAESLAALGWQPFHTGGFVRDGEALHLTIESLDASGGQVRVEISVTPLN